MIKIEEAAVNRFESLWLEVATGRVISIGTAQHWDWIYGQIDKMLPSLSPRERDIFELGYLTLDDMLDEPDFNNLEGYYKSIGKESEVKRLRILLQELGYEKLKRAYEKIMLMVYKSWTRIRFNGYDLYVQLYASTKPYYDSFINFLQDYSNQYDIRWITVDTFSLTDEGDLVWDNVYIDQALTSKSFRKY